VVREVQREEAVRAAGGIGEVARQQGRGVRREDRALGRRLGDRRVDGPLQVEVLGDRLDDQVRVADGLGEIRGDVDAVRRAPSRAGVVRDLAGVLRDDRVEAAAPRLTASASTS
jgi:hypothetical protein